VLLALLIINLIIGCWPKILLIPVANSLSLL
jgi:hypothetical protein